MKNTAIYLLSLVLFPFSYGELEYESRTSSTSSNLSVYEFNEENEVASWTDPKDGQVYGVLEVNGVKWMVDNYNFADGEEVFTYGPGSRYEEGELVQKKFKLKSSTEQKKHGRLYSYKAAQELAPDGWRLPTEKEWDQLIDFLSWNSGTAALNHNWFYQRSKAVNLHTSGFKCILLQFTGFGQKGLYWANSGKNAVNATYFKKMHRVYGLERGTINSKCALSVRYVME